MRTAGGSLRYAKSAVNSDFQNIGKQSGVLAGLSDKDVTAGAVGAGSAPLIGRAIAKTMYGSDDPKDLSDEQKNELSQLTSVAGGLLGMVTSKGGAVDAATAAAAAKNEVENNSAAMPPVIALPGVPLPPILLPSPGYESPSSKLYGDLEGKTPVNDRFKEKVQNVVDESVDRVRALIGTLGGYQVVDPYDPNSYAKKYSAGDKLPYTPDTDREKFSRLSGGDLLAQDGSVWSRDKSEHGGAQWKRFVDKRTWGKHDTSKMNSVWPDGRVRK